MHDLSRLPKIRSNERPAPGEFIIALSIPLYIPFFIPPPLTIYSREKKGKEEYERQACVVNLSGVKFRDEKRFRTEFLSSKKQYNTFYIKNKFNIAPLDFSPFKFARLTCGRSNPYIYTSCTYIVAVVRYSTSATVRSDWVA